MCIRDSPKTALRVRQGFARPTRGLPTSGLSKRRPSSRWELAPIPQAAWGVRAKNRAGYGIHWTSQKNGSEARFRLFAGVFLASLQNTHPRSLTAPTMKRPFFRDQETDPTWRAQARLAGAWPRPGAMPGRTQSTAGVSLCVLA